VLCGIAQGRSGACAGVRLRADFGWKRADLGRKKGRFANKIEQKSTFFDTDFKVFVLIIKELN
jgi:hypothetical protein